jgi:hypothetical protein
VIWRGFCLLGRLGARPVQALPGRPRPAALARRPEARPRRPNRPPPGRPPACPRATALGNIWTHPTPHSVPVWPLR